MGKNDLQENVLKSFIRWKSFFALVRDAKLSFAWARFFFSRLCIRSFVRPFVCSSFTCLILIPVSRTIATMAYTSTTKPPKTYLQIHQHVKEPKLILQCRIVVP